MINPDISTDELLSRLSAYGADTDDILHRFCGNKELFRKCVNGFFNDESLSALDKAFADKDYDAAFSAAHTVKGLTGNLGFVHCYKAVSELVEALRNKSYDNITNLYDCAKNRLTELEMLLK